MTPDAWKRLAQDMVLRYDDQLRILEQDIVLCFSPAGNPETDWPGIRDRLSDMSDQVVVQQVRAALWALSKQEGERQSVQPIHDYLTSRSLRLFPSWNYHSPNLQQVPRK